MCVRVVVCTELLPSPVYWGRSPHTAHQPCPVYQILTFLAQDALVKGFSLAGAVCLVVAFLRILLGFRALAEEACTPLYEFFCGTLTVTVFTSV